MAYYYKLNESEDPLPVYKGFHLQKVKKFKGSGPKIRYDFSKHVLIELLDDSTPESEIWDELGLKNNKNIVHKRLMLDSHRIKCRRAVIICVNADEAKQLAQRLSQTKVMNRCVCAVVIQDLLSDLCLFEKQIIQFGDTRSQQQLLYVSDLNRCRGMSGLVKFLKEKFSPFGTILSVLVCPDDDEYACPEGVIKFAYLSEAFAAELAFDQYVVGKERLSVTAHHNILLSQCDLRVRLRDAQWRNNAESCSESPFFSYNHSYVLNDLDTLNEEPVVKSMINLKISSEDINVTNNENISNRDNLSISYPESRQYNLNIQCNKSMSDQLKKCNNYSNTLTCSDKRLANFEPQSKSVKNVIHDKNNIKTINTENRFLPCYRDQVNYEKLNSISEIVSNDMTITNQANESHNDQFSSECNLSPLSILQENRTKKSKNNSDSISFATCSNYPDPRFQSSLLSSEKTIFNSFHHSQDTMSEYFSLSSECKQFSSIHDSILNDSEIIEKSVGKNSKKRRKHFTSSQKLCLKSQRIGPSQSTFQNACTKSEISDSSSSQHENSIKCNKTLSRKNVNLMCATTKLLSSVPCDPGPSKVTKWLSHLPSIENTEFSLEENANLKTTCKNSVLSRKHHNNRISLHNAPSLKSSKGGRNCPETSHSDNSSVENEDPNEKPVILSDENFAMLLNDDSRSPLQNWLKQELTSSTNNSVIKSQTAKSIIVCAAKTKDVIISVGCSYMTCDSCYPESTDLLLGYS